VIDEDQTRVVKLRSDGARQPPTLHITAFYQVIRKRQDFAPHAPQPLLLPYGMGKAVGRSSSRSPEVERAAGLGSSTFATELGTPPASLQAEDARQPRPSPDSVGPPGWQARAAARWGQSIRRGPVRSLEVPLAAGPAFG